MTDESYSVWVGGGEINGYPLTLDKAEELAYEWRNKGYDDVVIEHFTLVVGPGTI